MKLFFKILCLFLVIHSNAFAQNETFEDINNRLFCNVYTYGKADSLTNVFLKENFPYLTKKRPAGRISEPPIGRDSKKTIVTMTFRKHPFFDFNITNGYLNFQTVETPGQQKFEIAAELYLFFSSEQSADSAFNQLIELYKSVSIKQDLSFKDDQKIGKFIGTELKYYTPKALVRLSKDGTSGYKIYFRNWRTD